MNSLENKAKSIFLAAVECHHPEQWSAYLDQACAGDRALRGQVEILLHAHAGSDSLLDHSAPLALATIDEPVAECPGTVIGPYKLMEQIGEGGMGLVYVAEQQQPVRRKVALKVLKPGMDTKQVIARFEAERQALALMDHPHIAKVLDGGATASGRPYFVMELVKGAPITEYCDHNQVPIRQRLELFGDVCAAVQHAHQKGIIHRDIKPSNVLVVSYDGTPLVKVIDFGIAKAIGQQLTDKTLYTQFTQLVGTPLYMSPEQAGQSGVDVDTRTDVYALGVLLYELLTGTTPFDRERFKEAGYDEMRRIIREEEPPKPSTRLRTDEGGRMKDETKRTQRTRWDRLLPFSSFIQHSSSFQELDWVVMKCLEKDRNRRYESASAVAADVQRYLKDEPVQACPPSAWYRFRKLARRNKTALTIGGAALLLLIGAVVTLSVSIALIAKERNLARDAALRARNEGAKAERERQRADANFLKARTVVDKVVTQAAAELADVPRVEPIRRSLLDNALKFYEAFLQEGVGDPAVRLETARAYQRVALIHGQLGEGSRSEKAWEKAIELLAKLALEFPAEAEHRVGLAVCYGSLADRYRNDHRLDQAVAAQHRTLTLYEDLVAEFPNVLKYRRSLAGALVKQGMMLQTDRNGGTEAEVFFQRALVLYEKTGGEFPLELESAGGLAYVHWSYGKFLEQSERLPESERHLRRSLQLYEEALKTSGRVERWLANDFNVAKEDLARLLNRMGRPREAERYMREVNEALEKQASASPHAVSYWARLARHQEVWGLTLFGLNRTEEAEQALRKCVENAARLHDQTGEFIPDRAKGLAWGHFHLGELLRETGRVDEAAEQFRRALGLFEENADRFPDLPRGHYHLAWVLAACPDPLLRDPARAVRHARRALELGPETGVFWTCLGIAQFRAGQWQVAAEACEKGLRLHPDCDGFEWFFLAMAQWRLGQKEQARQSYASGLKQAEQRPMVELELRACRREAAALLGMADSEVPPSTKTQ